MRKYLDYTGLQTLVERIKSCYLLEIGVSRGAGAFFVDSSDDQAEINAIVEGNAPMPIAVKLHMADNDTDYIVNTCQVRGGYFMLYIPDDMVLTDIDGMEFTGTWMTFMGDYFTAAVDYYATSVDLRNSTQVITDTSKATSSNVLYLVADSSKNVTGVVYNSKTYTFAAEKGEKGDKGDTGATGVGITSVKQTYASLISGDTNVVEITTSDGKTSQVKIRNGNASTSGTEIVQTTGQATDKVMSQKAVTDALNDASDKGDRSFTAHDYWNFNQAQNNVRSAKKWSTSSLPVIDVVKYSACQEYGGWQGIFAISPDDSTQSIEQMAKSANGIFVAKAISNVWICRLVVRRGGSEVMSQDLMDMGKMIVAMRLNLAKKTLAVMTKDTSANVTSTEIDLSAYNLDFGDCYIYTAAGCLGVCADTYIGYNSYVCPKLSDYLDKWVIYGGNNVLTDYEEIDGFAGQLYAPMTGFKITSAATKVADNDYKTSIALTTASYITMYFASSISRAVTCVRFHIKISGGSAVFSCSSTYGKIVDVFDSTTHTTADNDGTNYTLPAGDYVVQCYMPMNAHAFGYKINGTCDVEIYDFNTMGMANVNVSCQNYDGKYIYGPIKCRYDHPETIVSLPMVDVYEAFRRYCVVGMQRLKPSTGAVYMTSVVSGKIVEKQINNN